MFWVVDDKKEVIVPFHLITFSSTLNFRPFAFSFHPRRVVMASCLPLLHVITCLSLTLLARDVGAVRCYRCNYVGFVNGTSRCNDPINPRYPPTSTCIGRYCTKLKGTTDGKLTLESTCQTSIYQFIGR